MELKHGKTRITLEKDLLLIVPYGIETRLKLFLLLEYNLLIVPYGIETQKIQM